MAFYFWRISSGGASEYSDNGLIYASGVYGYSYPDNNPSETDAGDIFSGTKNVKLLAHWTDSRNPFFLVHHIISLLQIQKTWDKCRNGNIDRIYRSY